MCYTLINMVVSCSGCKTRKTKGCTLSFHRFPLSNPILCGQWVRATGRKYFTPTKYSFLCSRHFKPDDLLHLGRIYVKDGVVPSIFDTPDDSINFSTEPLYSGTIPPTPIPSLEIRIPNFFHPGKSSTPPNNTQPMTSTHPQQSPSSVNNYQDVQPPPAKIRYLEADFRAPTTHLPSIESISENECVLSAITSSENHLANVNIDGTTPASPHDPATSADSSRIESAPPEQMKTPRKIQRSPLKSRSPYQKILKKCRRSGQPDTPRKRALKKKIKTLQQTLRRKNEKIESLEDIIKSMRSSLDGKGADILKTHFEGFPLELALHITENKDKSPQGQRYRDEVKKFALTLYFYSPKAYKFVRKQFNLPHPARIRSWVSSVKCEPGIMKEVMEFIKSNTATNTKLKDCGLILDSMSLRTQTTWDTANNKYSGYTDIVGAPHEANTLASEALVFMLVSLKGNLKFPVAYFNVDKIGADLQSRLLDICLDELAEAGVRVWNATCDGAYANVSTFQELGCSFQIGPNFQTTFVHTKMGPVRVIFDACHMLKLARNALHDKGIIESPDGDIKWEYIEKLHKLQEEQGLKFANKLSNTHIHYKNSVMKVNLATQLLSAGVADALEYLFLIGHEDFRGCEATIKFIRTIDKLFDLLNSRNPYGKGFKSPLRRENMDHWQAVFADAKEYLKSLSIDGVPLIATQRKMFALGLIVTATSVEEIATALLTREEDRFSYVLTYKFSQDHLELFFSSIRSCGGWNNNPNTLQFKWALRKLLFKHSVIVSGNCTPFDSSSVSTICSFQKSSPLEGNAEPGANWDEHIIDHCERLESATLTQYVDNILYYIAGFVVRKLEKKIKCEECYQLLLAPVAPSAPSAYQTFVHCVTQGSLKYASDPVFRVIQQCEKTFRIHIIAAPTNMSKAGIGRFMVQKVVAYCGNAEGLFASHSINNESGCEDLHSTQLVRIVADSYLSIRLKTYATQHSQQVAMKNKPSIRRKLHNLILFSHS